VGAETNELIEQGWKKNKLEVEGTQWKYDAEKKNWYLNKKD
jgi:hypothetical protein